MDAYTWRENNFHDWISQYGIAEGKGILTTSLICLQYLIFGVAVIVTLVLNVGGTQDLQFRVRLSQVLHGCGHVQGGDPSKGANEQIQPKNLKHLIM